MSASVRMGIVLGRVGVAKLMCSTTDSGLIAFRARQESLLTQSPDHMQKYTLCFMGSILTFTHILVHHGLKTYS